jgi:hypothetical protein
LTSTSKALGLSPSITKIKTTQKEANNWEDPRKTGERTAKEGEKESVNHVICNV